VTNELDSIVGDRSDGGSSAVSRSVIHDDDLEVLAGLGQDAVDGAADRQRPIEDGNHHTYPWRDDLRHRHVGCQV
jgi:hypothetical protein